MSTSGIASILERVQQQREEHEGRMASDPVYRAEQEKIAAKERERQDAEKRQQERERREDIAKRRAEKRIPEKFWPYLDAWRAGPVTGLAPSIAEAHRWVEKFLRRDPPGWAFLFLAGTVGVGKTAAACWFLDAPRVATEPADPWSGQTRTVVREASGLFVTSEELVKASTYEAGSLWHEARDAQRLVLDDLGFERLDGKDWALVNLVALLCHRHANALPTVITMNMDREAFFGRYDKDGGRLRDRLRESAWFRPITGPSQRAPLRLEDGAA